VGSLREAQSGLRAEANLGSLRVAHDGKITSDPGVTRPRFASLNIQPNSWHRQPEGSRTKIRKRQVRRAGRLEI
jgi:hypothetical protein